MEDAATGDVIVELEDVFGGTKKRVTVDMLVLATGMQPESSSASVNQEGFAVAELQKPGIFSAGVAKAPVDVMTSIQDATGVALRAIQSIVRS